MTGTINPALFGMPDATTAGVPSGTTLTAYTGPMEITKDGTVIEGKIIDGSLRITGDNVTIKNCIIKNYGTWGIDGEGAANLSVLYCDFTASTSKDTNAAILGSGTFIGNDISQSENGIVLQGGASVVRDNYIHDLFDNFGEPHIDGISVQGGQNNVLIEHNTIESWDTSAVFIKNDFGPISNITVRNNLMYGDADRGDPAATVYVYGPNTTNVSITNNYVEKGNWYYYATSNANPTISGNIEWNNKTDATPYPTSAPTQPAAPTDAGAPSGSPTPTAPSGNSSFDGGPGHDKFSFNFKLTDAAISFSGDHVIVDGPSGSHTVLTGFKTYVFTDGTVNNNDGNPLVDDLFYYSLNHDVWNAHVDADQHYQAYGWHEGRDPNALFDTNGYLAANPDVANAHINPLDHYAQWGWREGRDPSPAFDTTDYLGHNPDVAAAHIDPLVHYLQFGIDEGRQAFSHAILGSTGNDILKGTTGSESFSGQGGQDTFVFAKNFGHDVIRDFGALGQSHDVLQFSKSVFDNFADVLSHASQVGSDVVISAGSDTLLLKNTGLGALDSSDFRFA